MRTKDRVKGILAGSLAVILASAAWASEGWKGELEQGYQINVEPSSDAKYQEYIGKPDSATLSGMVGYEDSDLLFDLGFSDQGGLNRKATLGLEVQKDLSVEVNFLQSPHLYSNDARTIYSEPVPGLFLLPDSLQMANEGVTSTLVTPNLKNAYNDWAHGVTVRIQDTSIGGEARYDIGKDVELKVGAGQKWRSGYRPIGTTFGFSAAIQLPEHLDQTTTEANVSIEYDGKDVVARLGYDFSWFDNRLPSMIFDDPLTADDYQGTSTTTITPRMGQIGLAPDNMANRVSLSVETDAIERTRISADWALGWWEQDQAFLPYTINAALNASAPLTATSVPPFDATDPANLPRASLQGVETTLMQNYQVTSRPIDGLALSVRYRDYEFANETPDIVFPGYVSYDSRWRYTPSDILHVGYVDQRIEGKVRYQAIPEVAVNGQYTYNWVDRTDREVEQSTENTLKGSLDLVPVKEIKLNGTYTWAHRVADKTSYAVDYAGSGDRSELRRFDVADRLRQDASGKVTLTPVKGFFLAAGYTVGQDDYEAGTTEPLGGNNTLYGLTGNDHDFWTFTSNWQATDSIDLSGTVDRQVYNYHQINQNRTMDTQEAYTVLAFNGDIALTDQVQVDAGWMLSHSEGMIGVVDSASVTAITDLPDTRYRMEDYTLGITYRINDSWSVTGSYVLEYYDVEDFQNGDIQNVEATPSSNAFTSIFLGIDPKPYTAHLLGISVKARL